MRPTALPSPAQPIANPSDFRTGPATKGPATFQALLARGPKPTGGSPAAPSGPLRRAEGPGIPREITDVITQLRHDEKRLDRYVRRAMAGQDLELPELVAMQSLVFRYSQRVELLSKLVDRVTGALKQTLQTQI